MPNLFDIRDINKEALLRSLYALAVASKSDDHNPIDLTRLQSNPHRDFNITDINLGLGIQRLSVDLNGDYADFDAYLRSQPSVTLQQITTILRRLRPPDIVPLPPRISRGPIALERRRHSRASEASIEARDRVSNAFS